MSETDAIIIGSDHAGYNLKEHIKKELVKKGIPFKDVGTNSAESTDYPIWAGRVAKGVADGQYKRGIVICGSGIGASIAANRFRGVRAALCSNPEMARLSRLHNNSNVLAMGERLTPPDVAAEILKAWLDGQYEGGRHERRVLQLDDMEKTIA
jgi:ribose 5-phosphate isomerase B